MNTFFSFPKTLAAVGLALAGMIAVPQAVDAKPRHKEKKKTRVESHHRHHDRDRDRDHHHRTSYHSHPRSSFVLSFGTGYAGRGYYYGPPSAPYYYESPGVRYYSTRSAVPRQYISNAYGSGYHSYGGTDASVQRALARMGYYNGTIDGDIGPGTSRAIARYQMDNGLPVTGTVTSSLLRSLGL